MAFGGGQRYFSGSHPRVSGCVLQSIASLMWCLSHSLAVWAFLFDRARGHRLLALGQLRAPTSCVPSRRRGNQEPRLDAAAALSTLVSNCLPHRCCFPCAQRPQSLHVSNLGELLAAACLGLSTAAALWKRHGCSRRLAKKDTPNRCRSIPHRESGVGAGT